MPAKKYVFRGHPEFFCLHNLEARLAKNCLMNADLSILSDVQKHSVACFPALERDNGHISSFLYGISNEIADAVNDIRIERRF